MKNIIALFIVIVCVLVAYRSCTRGYDRYGVFVHVKDEALFDRVLSASDPGLMDHGRLLLEDIIRMDEIADQGNGPDQGVVRWYKCKGIDCDEGWETSFL